MRKTVTLVTLLVRNPSLVSVPISVAKDREERLVSGERERVGGWRGGGWRGHLKWAFQQA